MANHQQIAVLIANAEAEEVKMITLCFRAVFPGCRVEAIYSADDLLDWVSTHEWHVVFVDETLLQTGVASIITEIRKRLPKSAIIVQTDRNDISTAMQAIRAGADHCFYKKSPTFSTEVPAAAKVLLEKVGQPPISSDRSSEVYARLSEEMTEIVYELDNEGRFVTVGPGVVRLLGYTPEELIGTHFSAVIPEEERSLAEHRLNERRTGNRATRNLELRLKPKQSEDAQGPVDVELTAMGRYNQQRQIMGTVGVIRDIRDRKHAIQQREDQLKQQFRHREEELGQEFHQWEQQIDEELHRREEELRLQHRRREEELGQEHARLKTDLQQELECRRALQQREQEHLLELQRREEELRREIKEREEQFEQQQRQLQSTMKKELEQQRLELKRREEELRRELQQQEERFTQEKANVDVYLQRELKQRESRLREEYQKQVEALSQERHRLETELEEKHQQQQEQLRQDAKLEEEKLNAERHELEVELERVLKHQQDHPDSSGTVLIVEPQPTVMGVTRTLLQQHGYIVVEAPTPSEAMAICKVFKKPLHLLLTDVGKAGMFPLELARKFAALRPEMKILFLSVSLPADKTPMDFADEGISFLSRPFTPDMLIRKIADTIDITATGAILGADSIRLSALP